MRTAVVAALLVAVLGCDRTAPRGAGEPPASEPPAAAVDSARGDSAALASLPPRLTDDFAVGAVLTAAALRDTARVSCESLGAAGAPEVRRRLRTVSADRSRTVLFARAVRGGGALRRVELVRRRPDGGQRGLIWTAATDAVQEIEWPLAGGPAESTTLPRGGPTARALRALARRLLALPCPAPRGR